jgi:hypothetical protein
MMFKPSNIDWTERFQKCSNFCENACFPAKTNCSSKGAKDTPQLAAVGCFVQELHLNMSLFKPSSSCATI